MTTETPPWLHPLFDPNSHYRKRTSESVWSDGGVESIRRFFRGLENARLRRAWMEEKVPEEPQDWGHIPEVNALIHKVLLKSHTAAQAEHKSRTVPGIEGVPDEGAGGKRVFARGRAYGADFPALLRYDVGSAEAIRLPRAVREPASLFTGINQVLEDEDIPYQRFRVDIPGLEPGRRCLALLVSSGQVEEMAGLLESGKPWTPVQSDRLPRKELRNEAEVIAALTHILQPATLEPADKRDPVAQRLASQVAMVLARSPGLEVTTTNKGAFSAKVEIFHPAPYLDFGTYLVLCVGPVSVEPITQESVK